MGSGFVHLHNHTEYSILDGAARIPALFEKASRLGMPAIAVTDHGVMYGAIDYFEAGQKAGVKPIIGAELYVATRSRFEKSSREKDFNHHLTVIATSNQGYRNLMRLVTTGWLEGYYYRPRVDKEALAEHAEGLIGFSGCLAGEVCSALKIGNMAEAERVAGAYRDIFGPENYFIELQDHGLEEQRMVLPQLVDLSGRLGAPLVATNDLHYTERTDAGAHDALLCIQTNAKISDPGRFKFDAEEFYLKTAEEMRTLFAERPDACDNTLAIAERCDLSIEFGTLHLPPFVPPTEESQEQYLRRLVAEGATRRYGDPLSPEARDRIEHELGIILRMGFAGYFLIVADLIQFARSRGIRVGPGRGSAAGSVVSYCLGITDLDPIRYGLIFERFLNPDRRQMPDIDMDFDERGRGEMIRYATERYGEDHVAQIVTFGTIKGKQAIRDAARVLDLPYGIGDRLAKMYPPPILGKDAPLAACFDRTVDWPDPGTNEAFSQASDLRKANDEDEISRKVLDIARELEGLRRQVSVHAAGVVIGDEPLVNYTPLQRAQDGAGGIVTQYEMHAVENLGLLKMDFLGLRTLTVLEDAVRNVKRTRGIDVDIDAVPLDHAPTYEMLTRGDTIAIFQLESPGMRELVKKLRPDRFEDVMALVALYRPGPLGERMHLEYAARKHGQRTVEYLHADLKPILEETFGIILYQEQALRIAVDMAGFSMAEADTLRKAIGKKIGDVMRAQREKFLTGCVAKGYTKDLANKLWEMIDHFSGYGFNKSHSCGYAYIAFQTAYLKSTYPVDYLAALLTSVKDKQDRTALYLAECRTMGITVDPPDVNLSASDYTPLPPVEGKPGEIRIGLSAIRNVGENVVAEIIREREKKGPFGSFADFCHRVDPTALNKRVVESFVKAGAFDSLGLSRGDFLTWGTDTRTGEQKLVLSDAAATMLDAAATYRRNEDAGQSSLFSAETHHTLVDPAPSGADIPRAALLAAEKEMLGLYVSEHPLLEVEKALRASTDTQIADIAMAPEGSVRSIGGIISRFAKKFTKKGEAMGIITLEDLAGAVEVVVFPAAFQKFGPLLERDSIICVKGKIDLREDEPKVVALEVWRPNLAAGGDPLVLTVAAEACTPKLVEELKVILHSHPGLTPVHLRLMSGTKTKVLRLPDEIRIERRNGLYAELKTLLGTGSLA
ncbi:MAG: DNA polymerase III subunit alpha [Actinomycetota bacterium]